MEHGGKSQQEKSKICLMRSSYMFHACMKRFLYVRCYDSLELLSNFKIFHYRIQQQEVSGSQVGVLMIDGKSLSLTNVVDTIVQELKMLQQMHSVVVIATKATLYEEKYPTTENNQKFSSNDDMSENVTSKAQQPPYMPSSWQAFVTHKIIIRKSADHQSLQMGQQSLSAYLLEWLQPQLSSIDRFIVDNVRIHTYYKPLQEPFYLKPCIYSCFFHASSFHGLELSMSHDSDVSSGNL